MMFDKMQTQSRLSVFFRKNRALILALGLTLFASLLFWKILGYCFELNDDAYIASIVNGYHGESGSRLIYVNTALGSLLSWLFNRMPFIPWYFVAECGTLALSFCGIFYVILKEWDNAAAAFPITVIFVCFASDMFSYLQYTKTAGVAGVSGALLLLYALTHKGQWLTWCIGVLLAVIGFCFRLNGFAMVIVLLSGAGLYELNQMWKARDWKKIRAVAVTLVTMALICAGLYEANRISYQKDPEWKEYTVYNTFRTELLDYGFPDYEENRELYTQLNISEADVAFYRDWNFDDPDIMSISVMQQLVGAKNSGSISLKHLIVRTKYFLKDLILHEWFVGFAVAIAAAFVFGAKEKRWLLFYECIVFSALELYLIYTGRYGRNRVDVPLCLAVVCVLSVYCIDKDKLHQNVKNWSLVFLVLTIIFAQTSVLTKRQMEIAEKRNDAAMLYSVFGTTNTDKKTMYLSKDHGLPADRYTGLAGPVGLQSNTCYLGGWMTHSPIILEKQRNYGITNPYRDMIDNENVRLLSKDIADVMAYIQAHYAQNAAAEQVKMVEGEFPVYRIVTKPLNLCVAEAAEAPAEVVFSIETNEKKPREISGIMYLPDTNSFASNVYLGVKNDQGQDMYFYTLQTPLPEHSRIMDGKYGRFSARLDDLEPGEYILTAYLETGDQLYSADGGMITIPQ